MFIPISPIPPRGMIRTQGSDFVRSGGVDVTVSVTPFLPVPFYQKREDDDS
jgi:hypothetical protein